MYYTIYKHQHILTIHLLRLNLPLISLFGLSKVVVAKHATGVRDSIRSRLGPAAGVKSRTPFPRLKGKSMPGHDNLLIINDEVLESKI